MYYSIQMKTTTQSQSRVYWSCILLHFSGALHNAFRSFCLGLVGIMRPDIHDCMSTRVPCLKCWRCRLSMTIGSCLVISIQYVELCSVLYMIFLRLAPLSPSRPLRSPDNVYSHSSTKRLPLELLILLWEHYMYSSIRDRTKRVPAQCIWGE